MSKRWLVRTAALVLCCFGLSTTGWAYYYFVFFNTRTGPFNPIVEKFDLTALTNNAVPFFVSDQPPVLAQGDSFQAIIGEIRGAADIWNGVSTSAIRLSYGGLFTVGRNESAPGIDIEFSNDIPPGLLAMSAPTLTANPTYGPGGLFTPILRSTMYLPSDLTQVTAASGTFPSYGELFFVTIVHEFGHTLGLQHTLSSSVMSTYYTTAASKAQPLGADDIAAISQLYPADKYLSTVGGISGRVTMNGSGVNLASVVAISPSNPAISTLTNPDGTYQINGIPPGQYYVYAHPLPSPAQGESTPANVVPPMDVTGKVLVTNYNAFATQFYNGTNGGTRDTQQAQPITVGAANVAPGVNFQVVPESSSPVSAVRTWGYNYQGNVYVSPAPLTLGSQGTMVAEGMGLLEQDNVTISPGLKVSTMGTAAQITALLPYSGFLAMYAVVNFTAGPGPKHLLFSTPADLYVLPAGFTVVNNSPPSITSVAPTVDASGMRAVLITGTSFFPDSNTTTSVLFDGRPGIVNVTPDGNLLVTPPPAPGGYVATVEALNSDGQSSLFTQPVPPTYTYDPAGVPSLTVMPMMLTPGADATVDIVGVNTFFVDGQTSVGFGTSDVTVKKVTVLSPAHVSVLVTPNASVTTSGISVTTGLGIISQALGNQITTTNPQQQ